MSWKRKVATHLSSLLAHTHYRNRVKNGHRILMYHSVGGQAYQDILGLYHIDASRFESQMDLLSNQLPRQAFVSLLEGMSASCLFCLTITFDDGYRDNLTVAAPILAERHIPFTVFVTSGFVESDTRFLTRQQLRELSEIPGATVGAHGMTHRPLSQLSPSELRSELRESRQFLEDIIGQSVTTMSCPHGSISPMVMAVAQEEGYVAVATSHMNINGPHAHPLSLSRVDIVSSDTPQLMWNKVQGAWDWVSWVQKAGRAA